MAASTTAIAAAAVVSVLSSAYFTEKNIQQQKKATKRANRLANEQAAIEKREQETLLKEERRKNRNLLAQQQSAYKARLGSSGLSSETGSGQVVLNAMQNEADMEDKYLANKHNFSLQTLNNRLQQTNSRNLLSLNQSRLGQQKNVFNAGSQATKSVLSA